MSTAYHARYFAYELTRPGRQGVDRLSQSLFNASVDLNPHQVEAALFALRSPLSKGVLLADEVGLGKTIEAGLVLCQHWAERKRRSLVVCPASLRKQWQMERFGLWSGSLCSRSHLSSPAIPQSISCLTLAHACSRPMSRPPAPENSETSVGTPFLPRALLFYD